MPSKSECSRSESEHDESFDAKAGQCNFAARISKWTKLAVDHVSVTTDADSGFTIGVVAPISAVVNTKAKWVMIGAQMVEQMGTTYNDLKPRETNIIESGILEAPTSGNQKGDIVFECPWHEESYIIPPANGRFILHMLHRAHWE